jgi:hypothetical protein
MDPSMEPRRAGQHGREVIASMKWEWLGALGAAIAVGLLVGLVYGIRSAEFIGAEVAVVLCSLFVDRRVVPELERRRRGVQAEEHVGEILDGLSESGWRVIHDLDTGRGNIDHVVVGPGGVFTIETKSHGGHIDVDRIDASMWRQAYAQAKHVEALVGAKVIPLLVFSRAYLSRPVARRRGVTVLPARLLEGHLARYGTRLSSTEIARLTGAIISR